jgi:hypothetical protein
MPGLTYGRRKSTHLIAGLLGAGVYASATAQAASSPTLATGHGCYLVGQKVMLTGVGFAPSRQFVVSVDGVEFKGSLTDVSGGFTASLRPGGLGRNVAQHIARVSATDGTVTAGARFTITRRAGARILASSGNPLTLKAPFEVWGFARDGKRTPLYLHYVAPSGRLKTTSSLGHAGGQCGYVRTPKRRVFPFAPSAGKWRLQIDTRRKYSRKPGGPVARIVAQIA